MNQTGPNKAQNLSKSDVLGLRWSSWTASVVSSPSIHEQEVWRFCWTLSTCPTASSCRLTNTSCCWQRRASDAYSGTHTHTHTYTHTHTHTHTLDKHQLLRCSVDCVLSQILAEGPEGRYQRDHHGQHDRLPRQHPPQRPRDFPGWNNNDAVQEAHASLPGHDRPVPGCQTLPGQGRFVLLCHCRITNLDQNKQQDVKDSHLHVSRNDLNLYTFSIKLD